jgi:hypothetical protein
LGITFAHTALPRLLGVNGGTADTAP